MAVRILRPADVLGLNYQQPVSLTERARWRLVRFQTGCAPFQLNEVASFSLDDAESLVLSGLAVYTSSS